jgi:excisionase family DNA binding protein
MQDNTSNEFGFDPDKILWSRKKAASYLGIAESTLASWAHRGMKNLPYAKIGRRTLYKKSDLDAFIATSTRGGDNGTR